MNEELIHELAIKAGFKKYDGELYSPYIEGYDLNGELEEFAERIIKECLDVVDRIKNDPLTDIGTFYKMHGSNITAKDWMVAVVEDVEREIKKQFGVEYEQL